MIERTDKIATLIASFLFMPVGIILFFLLYTIDDIGMKKLAIQCLITSMTSSLLLIPLYLMGIDYFSLFF